LGKRFVDLEEKIAAIRNILLSETDKIIANDFKRELKRENKNPMKLKDEFEKVKRGNHSQ
jgi:hypothetical protein